MPPPEPAQVPAPTPDTTPVPPVATAAPEALPTPVTPPVAPTITPIAPGKSLSPMMIGLIVLGVLLIGGGGAYAYSKVRPKAQPKTGKEAVSKNTTTSTDTSADIDTSDYRNHPTITIPGITLNSYGYLELSAYPTKAAGNDAHNTGGDDKLT